jgi:dTDP-4-dehydrorhamnose 3,5-epimerase
MTFERSEVDGAWIIAPEARSDDRGRFLRAWCNRELDENGIAFSPVQANMAYSIAPGTLRGLHSQMGEAKLVRCTRGAVFDLVADIRIDSPTYLRSQGVVLTPENAMMLYLPAGCAHGCLSLEAGSEIHYLTSAYYSPTDVRGARFDDPALNIRWPRSVDVVSDQDRSWPPLRAQKSRGPACEP